MTPRATFAAACLSAVLLMPALLLPLIPSGTARADAGAIVTDPSTGLPITHAMVARMVQTDAQAARIFDMSPPGAGAAEQVAHALREKASATDPKVLTMLAHSQATLQYAVPYLSGIPENARAAFVAKMRPLIMKGENDGERYLYLAEVLAGTGERGRALGGAGGVHAMLQSMLRSQQRMQNSMMGAIRAGDPACNVTNGAAEENPTYCHPY